MAIQSNSEKINVGGQAVLEGVMMRSPDKISVAVRKPSGVIAVKIREFVSVTKKCKILGWPIIRGGVILIESMVLGIQALNFSGEIAIQEDQPNPPKKSENSIWQKLSLALMVVFSLTIGMGLFFYVPLLLTEITGVESGFAFNFIDGLFRLIIFLLYIFIISRWKEIRRVFEYHGAEHKSIFAFERENLVTVEAAQKYTTLHPRCGTSFLMVVLVVSILVFIFLGKPTSIGERLLRLAFVPLIGGLSYEFIKFSDKITRPFLVKLLYFPGLWLQKLTTQEPDESQLEVAIVALKAALGKTLPENVELIEV